MNVQREVSSYKPHNPSTCISSLFRDIERTEMGIELQRTSRIY